MVGTVWTGGAIDSGPVRPATRMIQVGVASLDYLAAPKATRHFALIGGSAFFKRDIISKPKTITETQLKDALCVETFGGRKPTQSVQGGIDSVSQHRGRPLIGFC